MRPARVRQPWTPGRVLRLLVQIACWSMAAVTLTALGADLHWFPELFAHFRPHYIVVALGLAIPTLLIGPRRFAGVLVLCIGVHVWAMAVVPTAPIVASTVARTDRLKLMTWNVHIANPGVREGIELIRGVGADVVLLQEIGESWREAIADLRKDYPHIAPTQPPYNGGNVILSRRPFSAIEAQTIRDGQDQDPEILRVRVELGGRALDIVNVHPPYPVSAAYAARFARHMRALGEVPRRTLGGPMIMAGDFNATPWSPRMLRLIEQSKLRAVLHHRWWPATWPALPWRGLPAHRVRGIPIDHVLITEHFQAVAIEREPPTGSDHHPLVAEIVWK